MNGKNTDYEKYQYSVKEIIRYVSECVILCLVVDYLFYKNIWKKYDERWGIVD